VPGEHLLNTHHPLHSRGLSPRAWGARSSRDPALLRHRFIPTCVGSMRFGTPQPGQRAVHPHVRGEHDGLMVLLPHDGRFIPTCVGSTTAGRSTALHAPVHPHVRGEHEQPGQPPATQTGSSPRAWGAR